ncbi:hypothetical protein ABV578_000032 [Salmonella enterica]|nr:hypothetical protein [Salmonella enterica]EBS9250082.1 hypothetical protein [Salmonella enterica]ECP1676520.1 hypothetical protein [Salmonella enterica]EDX2636985.1 hypothetical protein [Salmonella enterica]EEG0686603.1 hypothetical protein [Salmonella enterica]
MQKFHYVYHTIIKSNRSGKIYHYVGKRTTTNLDDGYVGSGRAIKRMKAVNKSSETPVYEFEVIRSKFFDTAEEAFECETILVEAAREKWGRKGCLNIAPGGRGGFDGGEHHPLYGKKHKPETIEKFRKNNKGEGNPMFGKVHPMRGKKVSDETRAKMSKAMSGSGNPRYGKPVSEETREKMRLALTGKKRSAESVEKSKAALRKGEQWKYYDEFYQIWLKHGMPKFCTLTTILVKEYGYPKYNTKRMVVAFNEDLKK